MINEKKISTTTSLGNQKEKEEKPCFICRELHAVSQCPKLNGLSGLQEEERGDVMKKVNGIIDKNGVLEFGHEGVQTLLQQLTVDPKKQEAIIEKILTYYQLGRFEVKKDASGREQRKFVSHIIVVHKGRDPHDREIVEKIKLDERPIGYDQNFKAYVLRERAVEDGKINPRIRVGEIYCLATLSYEIQEKP